MSKLSLEDFIIQSGISDDHKEFVRKELLSLRGEIWLMGYTACLKHTKKKRELESRRRTTAVKRFLDYLHDLTHN